MKLQDIFLLAIDLQERLMPVIDRSEEVIGSTGKLLRAFALYALPVVVTEQYPKGLGRTVEPLRALLPEDAKFLPKTSFGCLGDEAIRDAVTALKRPTAVVAGVEAHVCVLQTVQELLEAGYQVVVCAEAVGSRSAASRELALADMRAMGARVLPLESILFYLAKDAGSPHFKAISALVKE